jgi:hypothetical protein
MHSSSRTNTLSWLVHLATRLLARFLNMPEPLVYDTGVFVFARVQAVESSIGRTFCPVRIWRGLLAWTQLWQNPPQ